MGYVPPQIIIPYNIIVCIRAKFCFKSGKMYSNFVSIPTARATLFSRVLICSLNSNLLSKMTPKYLVLLTTFTGVLLLVTLSGRVGVSEYFGGMISILDLVGFRVGNIDLKSIIDIVICYFSVIECKNSLRFSFIIKCAFSLLFCW